MRGSPLGQDGLDVTLAQMITMGFTVITAISDDGIRLVLRTAWLAAYRWNRIQQRQELRDVVAISPGDRHRQRNPLGVGDHVVLRTRFRAICGVLSDFLPPKTARTEPLSTIAVSVCKRPAALSLARRISWSFLKTSA